MTPEAPLPLRDKIRKILVNDWFMAAVAVAVFLITNRYIFGWDDQHLEVPLLKQLIEPALFQGDYYVESLKANFTTFLYRILSRFITVEQIPTAYFSLYVIARLFLFYFIYRFWLFICRSRFLAFLCVLALFMLVRPEEFIKRTFSHQVVSYPIVFAGLYLFYRSRYLASALIFGLAANIHALYGLFGMMYLSCYLLFFHKEQGRIKLFLRSCGSFLLLASPFILWTIWRAFKSRIGVPADHYEGWIDLYRISCGQNFILGIGDLKEILAGWAVFLKEAYAYIFIFVIYGFLSFFCLDFRKDLKAHAIALTVFISLVLTFLFTYIWPSHFVLDLNLVRHEQFLRFILGGWFLIYAYNEARKSLFKGAVLTFLLAFLMGKEYLDITVILWGAAVLFVVEIFEKNLRSARLFLNIILSLACLAAGYWFSAELHSFPYNALKLVRVGYVSALIVLAGVGAFFLRNQRAGSWFMRILVSAPLLVAFVSYCQLHYHFIQVSRHGGGFWQLQRNWEDMQFYVRDHTPKDAMILAPVDMEMGGFRIHSNRKVIVCFRDCGIIGFDYKATLEWQRRMKDLDAFKVMIKDSIKEPVLNAIINYRADYIVFMRYTAPPDNPFFNKIYENEVFSLYKVNRRD
jgi:hypothetical protein